jgi:preprotein translocase subunit SecG
MLYTLVTVIHIIVCIVLATVVLLQSSKGGGLAGAFGGAGGASQQLMGSRGMTTLLHKLTIYLAVAFFVTSFSLYFLGSDSGTTSASGALDRAIEQGGIHKTDDGAGTTSTPQVAPEGEGSTSSDATNGEG